MVDITERLRLNEDALVMNIVGTSRRTPASHDANAEIKRLRQQVAEQAELIEKLAETLDSSDKYIDDSRNGWLGVRYENQVAFAAYEKYRKEKK